ncbi:hypothetical protein LK12_04900 [Novosphingobium malaysiense]|uniref:histidine kinase n=1 Tax=Novosphingobium malaysiense TaxID=1348853 RepID=A0A0B1ZRG0_9SPHN|nr:hypothetical protein LK12_04900 [Novosphingobium malaysiense]
MKAADLPWLLGYALGFFLLHRAASPWSGPGFFSLWYPAAGWRFAMLWVRGIRMTPWLGLAEVLVDMISGSIPTTGPNVLLEAWGALRPAIAYGFAIAAIKFVSAKVHGAIATPPMPFGLASVIGPMAGALIILPLALLRPDLPAGGIHTSLLLSLTGYVIGDLLGVLVLAPPLVWLANVLDRSEPLEISLPAAVPGLTDAVILVLALCATNALDVAGLDFRSLPTLIAGTWIGLRHGSMAAWLTIVVITVWVLPHSAQSMAVAERLDMHMSLAATVIAAWIAGSYADAQKTAQETLERRNRLLFQAERLKTLRAMSVAVIHEISQPLATLAIEARHLHERSDGLDAEIAESIDLIDRKARSLSDLVRRLRRFGGRAADEPSKLPVTMLMGSVTKMLEPELRAENCRIVGRRINPQLVVRVQEIELIQAIVNLIRNAMAASSDGEIRLEARAQKENVIIEVANRFDRAQDSANKDETMGMGVGLMIARTIVEAHGGSLLREDGDGEVRFFLRLPLSRAEL